MARLFDKSSSQRLQVDFSGVTAVPLSFSFLMYPTLDDDVLQTAFCIINKDVSGDWWEATYTAPAPDNRTIIETRNQGTSQGVYVPGTKMNTWNHVAFVSPASNAHQAYLDNVKSAPGTTDVTPSGVNSIGIGAEADNSPGEFFNGGVAEVGVWNAALTDAEIALLYMRYSPLLVRPQNLVFYAPLTYHSKDFDIVGRLNMTAYNSPSWMEHPSGMIYPEPMPAMIGSQLPYFWTLPVAEEEIVESTVQLDTLSAIFSAEALSVSIDGGTEFPFSDDWTGADDAIWNATKWTTVAG